MNQIYDMATSHKHEPAEKSLYVNELRAIAKQAKHQQVNRVISELEILIAIQAKEEQNYIRYMSKKNHYSNVKPLLVQQFTESTEMLKKLEQICNNDLSLLQ